MKIRPTIPVDIERKILIESGHRCAVCGESCPLEKAHIVPWCKSNDHRAENLICLCANCHERADRENWGEKVLREYKKTPWILRQKDTFSEKKEEISSIKNLCLFILGEQLKRDKEVTRSVEWSRLINRGSCEYGIQLKLDLKNTTENLFDGLLDVGIETPDSFPDNENGYKVVAVKSQKLLHIASRTLRILPGSWDVIEFTVRADLRKIYPDLKDTLSMAVVVTSEKESITYPFSVSLPSKDPTSFSMEDCAFGRSLTEEGLGPIEKHAFWEDN